VRVAIAASLLEPCITQCSTSWNGVERAAVDEKSNKEWWPRPSSLALLLLGALVLLGSSSAAPFIYTLF
jgi:hypothetical protein